MRRTAGRWRGSEATLPDGESAKLAFSTLVMNCDKAIGGADHLVTWRIVYWGPSLRLAYVSTCAATVRVTIGNSDRSSNPPSIQHRPQNDTTRTSGTIARGRLVTLGGSLDESDLCERARRRFPEDYTIARLHEIATQALANCDDYARALLREQLEDEEFS